MPVMSPMPGMPAPPARRRLAGGDAPMRRFAGLCAAVILLLGVAFAPAAALSATPQMEAAREGAGIDAAAAQEAAPAVRKGTKGRAARQRQAGKARKGAESAPNVYAGQPAVTEKEVLAFVEILPRFRAWAREGHEEAHPVVRGGKADFLYSPRAAEWVSGQGWQPARFFCVMGRLAAALVIVEEGNDMRGTRPADMPSVTPEELTLVRTHLGSLLAAGGDAPPIRQ